jgi:hypothetical protein
MVRYDLRTERRNLQQSFTIAAIVLAGAWAFAIGTRLVLAPLFWLWLSILFIICCLFGFFWFLLNAADNVIWCILVGIIIGISGLVFISAYSAHNISDPHETLLCFFVGFLLSAITVLNLIDYRIIRRHKDLSAIPPKLG